ncbi:MAG: Fic family protein [Candidatus Diapherotrites archaeon]|nr:Fic family protein [Candidatus Diapherotrites archaeon]
MDRELFERILEKKNSLDKARPLSAEIVQKLRQEMEIEWTYNSNAIEGNSLSYEETRRVVERGLTIGGKSLREHFEAINHVNAIRFIEKLVEKKQKITEQTILEIHSLIVKGIDGVREKGQYRSGTVFIGGAVFTPPPPIELKARMLDLIDFVNKNPDKLHVIELAAISHHKLVWIHPFVDGNGRTARILMNLLLMKKGFPPTVILNVDRQKYYRRLKEADRGKSKPFVDFVARNVERNLDLYLKAIKTGKDEQYISLQEATRHCDYSQEYLSLQARNGKLEAHKLGRNWFTTKKAIQAYLKKHATKNQKLKFIQ